MSTTDKRFSHREFGTLLTSAAEKLRLSGETEYCSHPLPRDHRFILPALSTLLDHFADTIRMPQADLLTAGELTARLLSADGAFPDWINLSLFAFTDSATVFDVEVPERRVTKLITGELALPFEPFHLLGPALPSDWEEGAPIPRRRLPLIEVE